MSMKKTPVKKTTKAPAKKIASKKGAPAKAPVKKAAVKKAAVKKAASAKVPEKKSAVKKTLITKELQKKTPARKVTQAKVPAKKVAPKKAPVRKALAAKQLTESDIVKFQKMLLAERERLIASINNIEEASRTESGRDNGADLASFAETGTDSFNLETALNIASSESQRLRDVIDALERIDLRVYGICEGSGKLIPKKRLEAFPSARYCVEYQQEIEKEEAMSEFR